MNSLTCSRRARENIKASVRLSLAQDSGFACSICGSIPIVFHHIEMWSAKASNDKGVLIPICDKCHRRIHGKGGPLFSKKELYQFKANPKKPKLLKDTLPLGSKRKYSFFIGSNFVADGEKASLFGLPGGHSLTSIDVSSGMLKLSVLSGIKNNKPVYLIRQNELLIPIQDVWNMRYSGSSLKIWKITNGKRDVFIDLAIKSDVIILRRMSTSFNGKPFCVRKLRAPQQRQIKKISKTVKNYEDLYRKLSTQISSQPKVGGVFNGVDLDALIKQSQRDTLRFRLEQDLSHRLSRVFNWDWPYFQWVLSGLLEKSPIFGKPKRKKADLPAELQPLHDKIAKIKARHKRLFENLDDVVAEYNGVVALGNIVV